MAGKEYGSLTKEPPLSKLDLTIQSITPGMSYSDLLSFARANTHKDAPGLIRNRFLLVNESNTITYDHFLSLAATYSLDSPLIRKIMYFLWAYRDDRIRRFVCECIANRSGQWQVAELIDKANANFFERWLQPKTATKARSNFEYFLVETKIFNPKTQTIHLELDDGWLEQAAIAAAQHEEDPSVREGLLADPLSFLEGRGWLGLLNIASATSPRVSPILLTDSIPLEDEMIEVKPSSTPASSDWDRQSPTASGKASTTANIDLIARERANNSHFSLEKILVDLAKAQGLSPKSNQNIDLHFETPSGSVLVEIKSCTDSNFHSQLRKAVSQLFEYRFVYKELFTSEVTMLLLMETVPPKEKLWLVDYVQSLGITIAWKDTKTQKIVSTCFPPKSLTGMVAHISI
jgi:hypothetical protein